MHEDDEHCERAAGAGNAPCILGCVGADISRREAGPLRRGNRGRVSLVGAAEQRDPGNRK